MTKMCEPEYEISVNVKRKRNGERKVPMRKAMSEHGRIFEGRAEIRLYGSATGYLKFPTFTWATIWTLRR